MRDHEVAHREFLRTTLGARGEFTAGATFRGVAFEDLGVAAYNGIAQYLTRPDNLLVLAKIASVEARHAATIRDLLEPRKSGFAPVATDDAFRPTKVAVALQANIADKLGFANTPATFVQGPNTNG